jgi:site-specific DNA-cytosine methylase
VASEDADCQRTKTEGDGVKKPNTVSLFCGDGGESIGKHLAFEELGIEAADITAHAINHWDLAVATHGLNLPAVLVHQEDITKVSAKTYGLKSIDLLWASPSCVHHSRAQWGGSAVESMERELALVAEAVGKAQKAVARLKGG